MQRGDSMAFAWALTSSNKFRSTWELSRVDSASTEVAGYPKENAIDGNKESEWRGDGASPSGDYIIIDTNDDAIVYDYIRVLFDPTRIPTSLKIETSANGSSWSGIDNQYDGTVTTDLSADSSGTSKIIAVDSSTNFYAGNTVQLAHSTTKEHFLVVSVGTGYIEVDRYVPTTYVTNDTVTLVPDASNLIYIANDEDLRYIKLTVITNPHVLEVQGFSVEYTFDNADLPLSPSSADESKSVGNIYRSFSGYGIGKMNTAPSYSKFNIGIPKIYKEGLYILEHYSQSRFGILMDDGRWYEGQIVGDVSNARRPSMKSNIVSYAMSITFEEV